MKYNKEQLGSLLIQKLAGDISSEDDAVIEKALIEDEEVSALWVAMQEKYAIRGKRFADSLDEEVAWKKLRSTIDRPKNQPPNFNIRNSIAIAAVFILIASISYYFSSSYFSGQPAPSYSERSEDVAIKLELADGRSIPLTANGFVDIGEAKLSMVDGKMVYRSENSALNWNTLSVPHKMEFKLLLSDGTEVWMNSASNLRFPFNFSDTTREVYLDGEAYFKVAKDLNRPFIVHAKGTDIEVLGTSFNVSSYGDKVVTSLVEGSVVNRGANQSLLLEAGQQSVFTPAAGFRKERFEAERALSWMSGVYYFDDISLPALSDVIWRWFEVKLIVEDPRLHKLTFTGAIEKNKSLDIFMRHLELTSGIKTKLEEGKLHLKK